MSPPDPAENRIRAAWWYDLLWSGIFLAAAWGAWHYFTELENSRNSGESVVMWRPVAVIYRLTGKWGVIVTSAFLSVVCALSGIRKFRWRP